MGEATHCSLCKEPFDFGQIRVLDHDHLLSSDVRGIVASPKSLGFIIVTIYIRISQFGILFILVK